MRFTSAVNKIRFPFIFSLLIFVLFDMEACIRFRPTALEEPTALLARAVLCNRVDAQNGWAEPSPNQKVFTKGKDNHVFYFLELRDIGGVHTLFWKWYDPSRKLFRAAEKISIGENGKVFEKYIAWDQISVTEEKENGVWTVAVFLDDKLFASREFEIR